MVRRQQHCLWAFETQSPHPLMEQVKEAMHHGGSKLFIFQQLTKFMVRRFYAQEYMAAALHLLSAGIALRVTGHSTVYESRKATA